MYFQSLRFRIFAAMTIIVVLAMVFTGAITWYQYQEQSKDYNIDRLERKEQQVLKSLENELITTYLILTPKNLARIFNEPVYEISNIQDVDFSLYTLDGELIKSSLTDAPDRLFRGLLARVMDNERFVLEEVNEGRSVMSSFFFLDDGQGDPVAIIHLPYFEENSFNEFELREFLTRLSLVYVLIFILALVLGYLVSIYISRPMNTVADRLANTAFGTNEKLNLKSQSTELDTLIIAYNSMVDALGESANKLAQSEREIAWKEMAKQVAHEIKNPLTPMRLNVQQFERSFDLDDNDRKERLTEFTQGMLQQIDTLNTIASAFSDFAKLPEAKQVELNAVEVVQWAVQLFTDERVSFVSEQPEMGLKIDRNHLVQIVNNLIKNALEAIEGVQQAKVEVRVKFAPSQLLIEVEDNGKGMSDGVLKRMFEPHFTTKNSGMGLGLAVVKSLVEENGGCISCHSKESQGTRFTLTFNT
jgi:two-component system, NtrC family, nitrogen regulation sensor histidine kinase NtrY